MKALRLPLLFILSLLTSTAVLAQVNCTTYLGGETSCYGVRGYHAEGRQYLGGIESWYDNRGNAATVRHNGFGGSSIDITSPATGGIYAPMSSPSSVPLSSGFNDTKDSLKRTLEPPIASPTTGHYGYSLPLPDRSRLSKTPEEYRLSALQTKAIEEKDFERAETLSRLLRLEKFASAPIAGRVQMFNEALSADRLELMQSFDRLEKRVRSEMGATQIDRFHKFKQKALITYGKQEAQIRKDFQEQVLKWKLEEEGRARFSKLEADLASLGELGLDPVELEKRETELVMKWGEGEDEHKKKMLAILSAELKRMVDEKAGNKSKDRK